nr:hypothetical protein Iba_chr10aCG12680 [Ipomoea batatas]GMD47301.1 hypothetical protein Iba_chr10eCG11600 [Ipomoea batatas]
MDNKRNLIEIRNGNPESWISTFSSIVVMAIFAIVANLYRCTFPEIHQKVSLVIRITGVVRFSPVDWKVEQSPNVTVNYGDFCAIYSGMDGILLAAKPCVHIELCRVKPVDLLVVVCDVGHQSCIFQALSSRIGKSVRGDEWAEDSEYELEVAIAGGWKVFNLTKMGRVARNGFGALGEFNCNRTNSINALKKFEFKRMCIDVRNQEQISRLVHCEK